VLVRVLLVAALAAAAAFLLLAGGREEASTAAEPAVVAAPGLADFARDRGGPVYWGGSISGTRLELTETPSGVFVRYLGTGVAAGDERPALTVATYPMANAFSTATRRSRQPGMASRRTRNAGIAVWDRDRPTSVYVAFRGSPALVEVFAPDARDAKALALSGRIRPAR
jgi:hypothetical protein